MKKLFMILCLFCTYVSGAMAASSLQNCLNKISNDETVKASLKEIFDTMPDDSTPKDIANQKNKIFTVLAFGVFDNCRAELSYIAKESPDSQAEIKVQFKGKEKTFHVANDILDYIDTPIGVLVTKKTNLSVGDVLELSQLERKTKFFPADCSPHRIWYNLDDDAAVNKAGQTVFTEYGGSKNEFFLDFADGDNRRAFPGLVLMDRTGSPTEDIVTYHNVRTAIQKTEQFSRLLKSTACANSGLAVYAVYLAVEKEGSTREKTGWKVAAGIGGSAFAWFSTATALSAAGTVTAASTGLAAGLYASAAMSGTVPLVGWIVSAALAATATAVLLYPQEIQLLDQVMVLDGPYRLN